MGQASAERYERLLHVSRSLRANRHLPEVLRDLPESVRPLLEFDYINVVLNDVALNGSGMSLDDAKVLAERGFKSVCTLPLATSHCELGSLILASKRPDAYPADEISFLGLVADQIATAIVYAEAHKRGERAELILNVNNSIACNLDLQEVLRSIAASVRRALRCDVAGVATPDSGRVNLQSYAMDFPESWGFLKEGHSVPIDGSALGNVFKSGRFRLLSAADVPVDPSTAKGLAEGIQFACIYPLINCRRTVGVLTVGRRTGKQFDQDEVRLVEQVANQVAMALDNAMAYRQISELKDKLAQEKLYLEDEIRGELNFKEIVGQSALLRNGLKQVETVAPTDSNVLIYGETGSGKELIARAIHDLSSRRANTFVKLNCAAIPTGLLESELFGHEKGAFTGAVAQRIGRFELANRGTLFLDEIGEIPLELQPKLLRVLQEREFERLGSSRTLRSEARVIAATNRDLAAMVEQGTFRADLFYRLNVFPVYVPPLRERREDIPLLVRHFVQQFARRMNKNVETIASETMNALTRYQWPGNIRELQNLIERAMILSNGPVLSVPLSDLKARPPAAANGANHQTLEDAERTHILGVLKETKWVLSGPQGAAARLGLNRSTLRFRMGKLGIARPGIE